MSEELHVLAKKVLKSIEEEDLYYELINNGGYRQNCKAKDFRGKE